MLVESQELGMEVAAEEEEDMDVDVDGLIVVRAFSSHVARAL